MIGQTDNEVPLALLICLSKIPLKLTKALAMDSSLLPLQAALSNVGYLDLMLRENPRTYGILKSYIIGLLENTYQLLGFDPLGASGQDEPEVILVRYCFA